MDLTPLYELRDRLRAGVIAGAALAADDFRLRRAVEGLAPLEKVPVFAKLGQLARAVIAPDCQDRAGAMLDAITLADAILCTQGAVEIPGPVESLALTNSGTALTNAPHSVLAPLLDALTTSGNGKYSFVVDTHDQRPELFRDYRVQGALVQALGAAYAELADKAEQWLAEQGKPVLPLLKSGFDPKGKKDMVRRVQTIEAIAGAGENDFYLSQIPEAEKDVRAALVYALRHDEGNAEKLIELSKTEKGMAKKMAFWAMARMECPEVWDYLNRSDKLRAQAMPYMAHATARGASALVADAFDRWLVPYEADHNAPLDGKALEELQNLLFALPGKSGNAICGIYRRMIALGTALDQKSYQGANGKSIAVRLRPTEDVNDRLARPFSEVVPLVLRRSILLNPAPDLLTLAEELRNTVNASFAAVGLTAVMLSRNSEEAYELAKPYLRFPPKLFGVPKKDIVTAAFDNMLWDRERGHIIHILCNDPADGRLHSFTRPLAQPLDRRWYAALAGLDGDGKLSGRLLRLTPMGDPEVCARVGEHLYKLALDGIGLDSNRLRALKTLGWKKCKGLAVQYCRSRKVSRWELRAVLENLPGDTAQCREEAQRVCDMIRQGKVSYVRASAQPEMILELVEQDMNDLYPLAENKPNQ